MLFFRKKETSPAYEFKKGVSPLLQLRQELTQCNALLLYARLGWGGIDNIDGEEVPEHVVFLGASIASYYIALSAESKSKRVSDAIAYLASATETAAWEEYRHSGVSYKDLKDYITGERIIKAVTSDKELLQDETTLKEALDTIVTIRRPILQGVAKENEQTRASNLRNAFYNIEHEYDNSRMRDNDARKMVCALEGYAKTRNNGTAPALKKPTTQMHVDFNKGDGWAFNTFLYEESNLYRFKDINPAEYLARLGAVTATFITDDIAVVTDTGYDSRLSQPLIVLTATTPTGQNLAGYSYTIDTVEPGGEWEPAAVTFKA